MTGLKIALKSLQLMLDNVQDVIRICAVLFIVSQAVMVFVTYATVGAFTLAPGDTEFTTGSQAGKILQFVSFIINAIIGIWIAVAWHRFILLEERPEGWIPIWHRGHNLAYFIGWLKVIFIVMGLAAIAFTLLILFGTLVPMQSDFLGLVFVGILFLLIEYLFLRLCLILPAAALQKPMGLSDSWYDTGLHKGAIRSLAIILVVATAGLSVANIAIDKVIPFGIATLVVNTFIAMWTLCVMTTLYGVIIEGRDVES